MGPIVPRGGLYAIRVMDEAIGLELPLKPPDVNASAHTKRAKAGAFNSLRIRSGNIATFRE